jgi:hypothetical protein
MFSEMKAVEQRRGEFNPINLMADSAPAARASRCASSPACAA